MAESKRTPGKWEVNGTNTGIRSSACVWLDNEDDNDTGHEEGYEVITRGRELVAIVPQGEGDALADAHFICKAVNSHDELLAALRMARRTMQNEWCNRPRIGMEEACAAADAAILLATA